MLIFKEQRGRNITIFQDSNVRKEPVYLQRARDV